MSAAVAMQWEAETQTVVTPQQEAQAELRATFMIATTFARDAYAEAELITDQAVSLMTLADANRATAERWCNVAERCARALANLKGST